MIERKLAAVAAGWRQHDTTGKKLQGTKFRLFVGMSAGGQCAVHAVQVLTA